jgi:hypothetical protein
MDNDERQAAIRRLRAELELLELYNAFRESAGHDYGNGQRHKELSRRRRELESLYASMDPIAIRELGEATGRELLAAWQAIGQPRLTRARNQPRGVGTPRTIRTLERVERNMRIRLDRELGREQRERVERKNAHVEAIILETIVG